MFVERKDRRGKPCGKSYIPQNYRCNPQKKSLSSSEVERIVMREEEEIRHLPYESAVIIDSESGEVLTKISGQQKSVDIEGKDLKHIRNNIVTHNHPTASIVKS